MIFTDQWPEKFIILTEIGLLVGKGPKSSDYMLIPTQMANLVMVNFYFFFKKKINY